MRVFKPIRIFLSSRYNTVLKVSDNEISLIDIRRSLKDKLEDEKLFSNRVFDFYTNESNYSGIGNGTKNSYEECFKALKASNVVVVLYTGEAGWIPVDSKIGICHEEFEHATRFFSSLTLTINLKKYRASEPQELDKQFDLEISKVNSTTPEAIGPERLIERILEMVNDFLKEKIHDSILSHKSQVASSPIYRPSIDWSHFTYSERVNELTTTLNATLSDPNLLINKQYNKIWGIPDNRFGFNGQERTNEISGAGNHKTAMFWEYDTRLGRRWNLDPVVKHNLSSYSCFTLNPIWNTDILGDDDLKFNNKGEYISGKERSKVHGFLFGSKGFIVDESGKTTSTFKFNDSKDSQKKKWEEGTQVFYKVNLKFGDEMEEEVQARIANAPKEPIARLKWVAIESKPKKEGQPMIDYYTNPTSNLNAGEINVVNGKGYNSMDGGNYLWGKSLAMLKIPYPLARAGSLANGFWNGRKQNSLTPNNGIFRITWYGDDRADQRAIRDGYSK